MTLHINDPKFFKERSESKPLSLEEQKLIVENLNIIIKNSTLDLGTAGIEYTQRLLYHYENLQSLSDFIGGWEGANRLMKAVDPMPDTEK